MIGSGEFDEIAVRGHLQGIENRLAAVVRGYAQLRPTDWRRIENIGLRLSLDAATLDPDDLPTPDGSSDLALSLLARTLENSSHDADYPTGFMSSLSALAFAAAGNFPTAGVVARSSVVRPDTGPFEAWALAVLGDRRMLLARDGTPPPLGRYAQAEQSALAEGSNQHFVAADDAFDECARESIEIFPNSDSCFFCCGLKCGDVSRNFRLPGFCIIAVYLNAPMYEQCFGRRHPSSSLRRHRRLDNVDCWSPIRMHSFCCQQVQAKVCSASWPSWPLSPTSALSESILRRIAHSQTRFSGGCVPG